MRNKTTRKIIKNFLTDQQVKFKYPITGITNPAKNLITFIDMEKLGEEPFDEFAISKTDTLLSIIETLENNGEVDINLDNDDIIIKNDKTTQKIRKSPVELFQDVKYESVNMIKENGNKLVDVELDSETLKSILGISKMLGLDVFILKDNSVITGKKYNNTLENENITKIDNGTFTGEIKLPIEHLVKLPLLDYKVEVYEITNANGTAKLSFWYPKDIEGVLVVIAEIFE